MKAKCGLAFHQLTWKAKGSSFWPTNASKYVAPDNHLTVLTVRGNLKVMSAIQKALLKL
jgi:hypothetical protein